MSPFWFGFFCGIGATIAACAVIGLLIPLILFCQGKGAIH